MRKQEVIERGRGIMEEVGITTNIKIASDSASINTVRVEVQSQKSFSQSTCCLPLFLPRCLSFFLLIHGTICLPTNLLTYLSVFQFSYPLMWRITKFGSYCVWNGTHFASYSMINQHYCFQFYAQVNAINSLKSFFNSIYHQYWMRTELISPN